MRGRRFPWPQLVPSYTWAPTYSDSMVDHELPPSWHTRGSAEANLAATTLLVTLPQLSTARLREQGTLPAKLWALAHLFADTILTMNAGQ
jgi:hypothetical protein